MLHTIKRIENKTSFSLNKSYALDLSAEIKREDEFCLFYSSSQYVSGGFCPASVGRLYTPRWRSTRRRTASGGQRNRKRPSARAPIRTPPRRGFYQRRQRPCHDDFDDFKANRRDKRAAKQGLAPRTMARQPPEDPEKEQIVGKNRDGETDQPPRVSAIQYCPDTARR